MKHLIKVGEIYYYRRRMPTSKKQLPKRSSIKLSLKTSDKEVADTQATALDALSEVLFRKLRCNQIEAQQVVEELKAAILTVSLIENRPQKPVIIEASANKEDKSCSELFQLYMWEKLNAKQWIDRTARENERCFALFLRALGDHPPKYYTNQALQEFRDDILQNLPRSFNINPRTKGKSLSAVVKMQHTKLLSRAQVNKYLTCVSAFFTWLHEKRLVQTDPTRHLLLSKTSNTNENQLKPYSEEEMKSMLNELQLQKDAYSENPSRFWIPLVAAYSGMRLIEICQLHILDVRKHDEIWCFDVNEEQDKRLKASSSARVIPIHPSLTDLGFLDYVASMHREGHKRLFPDLCRKKYNGYSRAISKWFIRFKRKYMKADTKKTFHSIRNAVFDALTHAGVTTEIINKLLGLQEISLTQNESGRHSSAKLLLEVIKKLPW